MLKKILKLLAVLLVAYLAVSAVRIYFWNKEMTQEIYRQYDELVAERRNCVLVPMKTILRDNSERMITISPHDKLDNIRDITALGIIWRDVWGEDNDTRPFFLAVLIEEHRNGEIYNVVYNWSFNKKSFNKVSGQMNFIFGLPQNTDEVACML